LGGRALAAPNRGSAYEPAAAKLLWRKLRREMPRDIVGLPWRVDY
jgi:hypothetical protein